MTAVEFAMGIGAALWISYLLAWGFTAAVLWVLGIPRLADGAYTPVAQYTLLSAILTILAHGKRLIVVPGIKVLNFRPRGEGHLLWERTLVRGVLGFDFRRRAYEVGVLLLVVSIYAEFGAVDFAKIPLGLEPKAVFAALGTFLALDTYLLTFSPKYIQEDESIDPHKVQSKVNPRGREGLLPILALLSFVTAFLPLLKGGDFNVPSLGLGVAAIVLWIAARRRRRKASGPALDSVDR